MIELISQAFDRIAYNAPSYYMLPPSPGLIFDEDENLNDIKESVIAFAEMVVELPATYINIEQDVLLILSIWGYLHPELEKAVGLNPIFPRPDDIKEYIKNRRKKIVKDTQENRIKRTSVKARVNRENYRRIKRGQYLSPLAAFNFFGDETA